LPSRVGVLALQGDFAQHISLLHSLDVECLEVRSRNDLEGIEALVIPGGESTTIAKALVRENLIDSIRDFAQSGRPVLGTCAGMVLLGDAHLSLIDVTVERNAFGSQVHSFEADLDYQGLEAPPLRGLFIRAPRVVRSGPDVEVLASIDGSAVAVRQDNITAISFHPELIGETRVHLQALEL